MASIPCPRHSKRKRIGQSERRTHTLEPRCATLYPLRYFFEDKGAKSTFIKNPTNCQTDSPTLDLPHRHRPPRYLPPNIVTKVKCLNGPPMGTLTNRLRNQPIVQFSSPIDRQCRWSLTRCTAQSSMVADKTPVCRKCRFSRLLTFFSAAIALDSGPVNWPPFRNA